MPSTFSWIDHSEDGRRRLLDILDTFLEQETRHELGISVIWESLFPPQTRGDRAPQRAPRTQCGGILLAVDAASTIGIATFRVARTILGDVWPASASVITMLEPHTPR